MLCTTAHLFEWIGGEYSFLSDFWQLLCFKSVIIYLWCVYFLSALCAQLCIVLPKIYWCFMSHQLIDSLHSSIYGDGLFSLARKCTILFHHSLWYSLSSLHFLLLQVRYEEIISDSAYLDGILAEGATKAAGIADATLHNVYQAMGFLRRWAEPMLQGRIHVKRPVRQKLQSLLWMMDHPPQFFFWSITTISIFLMSEKIF